MESLEFVEMKPPQKARIFTSIPYGCCGEMDSDTRTRAWGKEDLHALLPEGD